MTAAAGAKLRLADGSVVRIESIAAACSAAGRDISTLPYACRVLVENLARGARVGRSGIGPAEVARAVWWEEHQGENAALQVKRVILPDSSGLPVLLDLAALRDAVARAGLDPATVEPLTQVDVIVDHSLQVDVSARPDAMRVNMKREFTRNGERYRFLKWAQSAFGNVRIFPPGTGIIHQVNLEHIASVVTRDDGPDGFAFPDFVLGGDSHTPMINAIGVLGWGVGGIEAEAAMLGGLYDFPIPEFVGVRLEGSLPAGATTTDLVLHVTQRLRQEGVVGTIIEFSGPAVTALPVPARATLANMVPEYGATAGFFPIDAATIDYLATTRSRSHAEFVRAYAVANDLFRDADAPEPVFGRMIAIDLTMVTRSVAGPRRPQDRLDLRDVAQDFRARLDRPPGERGFGVDPTVRAAIPLGDAVVEIHHGTLAIAAITACTNTSNPAVMIAAGLLARNAVAAGLSVPSWVKTSLAPGSRVVTRYLETLGLLGPLEQLGFGVVGYGCTTCGGKSGPIAATLAELADRAGVVLAAVLSGNRNFEGRIHRHVRANYIASPPLVVAYALAGRIDVDLDSAPIGRRRDGRPVFLRDLWPSDAEVAALLGVANDPSLFADVYGTPERVRLWDALETPEGACFPWDPASTYLLEPPFLQLARERSRTGFPNRLHGVRVLGAYVDSLTTDHISPSGEIPPDGAAGRYLSQLGIAPADFNTYVGRRCNHEVMARGTFANLRIKNLLVPEREGGWTRLLPDGEIVPVHEAAASYRADGIPLMILGGRDYGMGSSRDWAAKGSALLGVRVVLAENFERIHRANLIGMGVLPLQFQPGEGWLQLGLDGTETFDLDGLAQAIEGTAPATITARHRRGTTIFQATAAMTTGTERDCLRQGGIFAAMLASCLGQDAGQPNPGHQ
ncbi:aconitate hydratase AcnA [Azospirillum sp. YIM B02556]|uniref:Aconitate hydratase n=1 Tax=Azospirillum endophyticum TaxID=2800326 RepID=A0ABS1FFG2_9PROT|nr:aconitate hydratase AcnA [Azospirillum endophyticum]MBK1842088.1 aconitate hydratase AcnA [Azospirillum endophyticum]